MSLASYQETFITGPMMFSLSIEIELKSYSYIVQICALLFTDSYQNESFYLL